MGISLRPGNLAKTRLRKAVISVCQECQAVGRSLPQKGLSLSAPVSTLVSFYLALQFVGSLLFFISMNYSPFFLFIFFLLLLLFL